MPRKKKNTENIDLVPVDEFEEAVMKVLSASKDEIDETFFEFQASNKSKRATKKQEKE